MYHYFVSYQTKRNVNFKAKILMIQDSSIRVLSHSSISLCYKCSNTAIVPDKNSIFGDLIKHVVL